MFVTAFNPNRTVPVAPKDFTVVIVIATMRPNVSLS